jgi:hypothetical protein
MIPVRQSTAFECSIGPVLDADGVAVTDCVVGDFKLKKTTGNFAALNGSATLTHVSAGTYDLVLTTSDLDTVGLATVAIDDTVNACAPVRMQVLEEVIYDALYAGSANTFQGAAGSTKVSGVVLTDTTTTVTNLHASAATAAELAKVPKSDSNVTWNATAAAQIQSEANDALVAYDPPTNAEMEARTLAAAAYFDPASDTVTVGTNNDKTGYGLSAAAVQAIWDAATTALTTVGSVGKRLVDFVTSLVYAAPPSAASIATAVVAEGALGSDVDAIKTRVELALPNAAPDSNGGLPIQQTVGAEDVLSAKVHLTDQAETDLIQSIPAEILAADNSVAGPANSVSAQLIDASLAATPAEVNTQCDQALADYDPPTKAELDSAVSGLATSAALATVDTVADAIKVKTDQLTFTTPLVVDASASVVLDPEDIEDIADQVTAAIGEDLAAIQAKTDLIGTATGELNAPLTNGSLLTLYKNGDYKLAHNRAIRVTLPAGTYPDITGATCRLGVTKTKDNTGGFVVEASAQSGHASNAQTIDFELDHATETGDLEPAYSYAWMCRIVHPDGGADWDNLDPISGKVKVLEDRVGNNAP